MPSSTGPRDPLLNPVDLSDEDMAALVAFLTAVTSSKLPEDLLGPPANFPLTRPDLPANIPGSRAQAGMKTKTEVPHRAQHGEVQT